MPWFARSRSSLPLFALAAVASIAVPCYPAPAAAEIRRCTDAHGNSVYTDRDCAAAGGVDRLPRGAAAQAQNPAQNGGGCARNLRDLVGQITNAIDAQDGNRLAAVYHWTGMSDDQAYAVLQRLDAIAHRPLIDIAPVLPSAPPPPEPGPWTTLPPAAPNAATAPLPPAEPPSPALVSPLGRPSGAAATAADADAAAPTATAETAAAAVAATPRRRAPVGLRLEQTLGNGITPSRTVFGLTRHFGCWWIKG